MEKELRVNDDKDEKLVLEEKRKRNSTHRLQLKYSKIPMATSAFKFNLDTTFDMKLLVTKIMSPFHNLI